MENIQNILENLGLNEKQAKVYLACLELGSASVAEVAEKSEVKRTSIYNFLEELINKGFVSEIHQDDQILLVAEDPKILEEKARQNLIEAQTALPELLAMFNRPGNKPKVHYYQGIHGLKKIYEDTLITMSGQTGTIYAFSDFDRMMPLMENFLWDYAKRRAADNISFLSVAKDGAWTRKVMQRDKEQKRQVKLATGVNFETEINIYGNRVALLSFQKPYAGVIIEDAAIAQTMKSIWQLLWDKL